MKIPGPSVQEVHSRWRGWWQNRGRGKRAEKAECTWKGPSEQVTRGSKGMGGTVRERDSPGWLAHRAVGVGRVWGVGAQA